MTVLVSVLRPGLTSGRERWAASTGCGLALLGAGRWSGIVRDGRASSAGPVPPEWKWTPVASPCLGRLLLGGRDRAHTHTHTHYE